MGVHLLPIAGDRLRLRLWYEVIVESVVSEFPLNDSHPAQPLNEGRLGTLGGVGTKGGLAKSQSNGSWG